MNKCEKCIFYEKPTSVDPRKSCSRLVDFLADETGGKTNTTHGFTVLIYPEYIKDCRFFMSKTEKK